MFSHSGPYCGDRGILGKCSTPMGLQAMCNPIYVVYLYTSHPAFLLILFRYWTIPVFTISLSGSPRFPWTLFSFWLCVRLLLLASPGLLSFLPPHALPRRSTWMNHSDFRETLGSLAGEPEECEEWRYLLSLLLCCWFVTYYSSVLALEVTASHRAAAVWLPSQFQYSLETSLAFANPACVNHPWDSLQFFSHFINVLITISRVVSAHAPFSVDSSSEASSSVVLLDWWDQWSVGHLLFILNWMLFSETVAFEHVLII